MAGVRLRQHRLQLPLILKAPRENKPRGSSKHMKKEESWPNIGVCMFVWLKLITTPPVFQRQSHRLLLDHRCLYISEPQNATNTKSRYKCKILKQIPCLLLGKNPPVLCWQKIWFAGLQHEKLLRMSQPFYCQTYWDILSFLMYCYVTSLREKQPHWFQTPWCMIDWVVTRSRDINWLYASGMRNLRTGAINSAVGLLLCSPMPDDGPWYTILGSRPFSRTCALLTPYKLLLNWSCHKCDRPR